MHMGMSGLCGVDKTLNLTFYLVKFIVMAAVKRFWKKLTKSSHDCDDWQYDHQSRLRPVLETLIQNVTLRRQSQRQELDAPPENLMFLNNVGFFEDLEHRFPSVEVKQDLFNAKLYLRGRDEEFDNAYNKCSWTLRQIRTKFLVSCHCWDLVAENHVREQINKIIIAKSIKAQVCLVTFYSILL